MQSSHSYNCGGGLLGVHLLVHSKEEYLSKLNEIVTLITTIDYNITAKEKKGIAFYKNHQI